MQVYLYGRNPTKIETLAKTLKIDYMKQAEKNHKFDIIISTIPPGAELPLCEEWFLNEPLIFVANHSDSRCTQGLSGKEMFEAQAIGQVHLFNGK